jgi:DNA-binding transcriptional ArsR family regulator
LNTTSVKNRRIRVALLRLLKTEYPGALDTRALQFALDNLGYPMPYGSLEAHLRYLEEKGYVALKRHRGFGVEISFASLSAQGWDLLDELISEKGVDGRL